MKVQFLTATILTFVLAAAAVAVKTMGIIDEPFLTVLIGLLGFTGLAELRYFLNIQGWKTYAVAVFGGLGIVGLLTGIATPEQVGYWFSFWGIIGGGTLAHGVFKKYSQV